MADKRVIVGFSGGIDSSAAVEQLCDAGYNVTALTLDMTGNAEIIEKAMQRARELGVRHEVLDVRAPFCREVETYFLQSYLTGRTPGPCTRCNTRIKWRFLLEYADAARVHYIATGHYFQIKEYAGQRYVARAADSRKDQSYYLWGLPPEWLSRILTPLGQLYKRNLQCASPEKESMGICFLRRSNYRQWLTGRCGQPVPGEIIDSEGRIVGTHDGIAFYTIGQKRGTGIPPGMSVVGIDAVCNRIVTGPDKLLQHRTLWLGDCRVTDETELLESQDIRLIVRGIGRNPEGYAHFTRTAEGYRVELENPAWAPAAGQPAVFYRGDRVLGGGIIEKFD